MEYIRIQIVMLTPHGADAAVALWPAATMIQRFGVDQSCGFICEAMSAWVKQKSLAQTGILPVKWCHDVVKPDDATRDFALRLYAQHGPRSPRLFVPTPFSLAGPTREDDHGQG